MKSDYFSYHPCMVYLPMLGFLDGDMPLMFDVYIYIYILLTIDIIGWIFAYSCTKTDIAKCSTLKRLFLFSFNTKFIPILLVTANESLFLMYKFCNVGHMIAL